MNIKSMMLPILAAACMAQTEQVSAGKLDILMLGSAGAIIATTLGYVIYKNETEPSLQAFWQIRKLVKESQKSEISVDDEGNIVKPVAFSDTVCDNILKVLKAEDRIECIQRLSNKTSVDPTLVDPAVDSSSSNVPLNDPWYAIFKSTLKYADEVGYYNLKKLIDQGMDSFFTHTSNDGYHKAANYFITRPQTVQQAILQYQNHALFKNAIISTVDPYNRREKTLNLITAFYKHAQLDMPTQK